jgi:hypothetical protein
VNIPNVNCRIIKGVDWEHNHPPGGIFHAAAFDNSGNNIRVADVWESKEELNKFVNERLMPVMQQSKSASTTNGNISNS